MPPLAQKTFICADCGRIRGERYRWSCCTVGCYADVCVFCVGTHDRQHPPEVRGGCVEAREIPRPRPGVRLRIRRKGGGVSMGRKKKGGKC